MRVKLRYLTAWNAQRYELATHYATLLENADLTLELVGTAAVDIFSGEVDAESAFTSGALKLQGDLNDAIRFNTLLELVIDPKFGSVMEYFELFLERMVMSRRAAAVLGCRFSLVINGARLI